MDNTDVELIKIISESYKDENKRIKSLFYNKEILFYNGKNSNWLYSVYEGERQIVIGVRGYNNERIEFVKMKSKSFFNNKRELYDEFKQLFSMLRIDRRDIILAGHSLGAKIIAKLEVETGAKFKGLMLAPYMLGENPIVNDFIRNSQRYKKIFYDTDILVKIKN